MEKEEFSIHKDLLIKSRRENILNHYDFNPKVQLQSHRNWARELMGSSSRPRKSMEVNGGLSRKSPRKISKILNFSAIKFKSSKKSTILHASSFTKHFRITKMFFLLLSNSLPT